LDIFALGLTSIECALTLYECPQVAMPVEKKEELENADTEATADPLW